jgi:hypothetical protein
VNLPGSNVRFGSEADIGRDPCVLTQVLVSVFKRGSRGHMRLDRPASRRSDVYGISQVMMQLPYFPIVAAGMEGVSHGMDGDGSKLPPEPLRG